MLSELPANSLGAAFAMQERCRGGVLVQKVDMAAGEAPLAVTAMMAIWLGARLLGEPPASIADRQQFLLSLGLVLAAMVNIKQSALELVLSVEIAGLLVILGGRARRIPALLDCWHIVPTAIIYGIWRWYATTSFPLGELKLLPIDQWNIALIPQIFSGIAYVISQKGTYFIFILLLFIMTTAFVRKKEPNITTIALLMGCAAIVLHDIFITITYVTHFDPKWAVDAHSYFRYMTQLSLIVVLGYALLLEGRFRGWVATLSPGHHRAYAAFGSAIILVLPFIASYWLRFDLATPQQEIARAIQASKTRIDRDAPLAILVPFDFEDIAGSFVRGNLLFVEPRLQIQKIATVTAEDAPTLSSLAAAGYHQALVGCSDYLTTTFPMPTKALALIRYTNNGWQLVDHWPYPAEMPRPHWSAMIPRGSFCGGEEPRAGHR